MQPNNQSTSTHLLLLMLVAMVGLNLRPFITGVGPLAEGISVETGLGLQGMALLTLVPMLLMGGFAFAGPSLQVRVGARSATIASLTILALGSLLRLFVTTGWGMVGTAALLGFGAAIIQAVFPGIIKRHFPFNVGIVMGLYSATLMGGGALGAQASPMIANAFGGWHFGLAWLAIPACITAVLAFLYLPGDAANRGGRNIVTALLKRPRAWLLMVCFGLVNGGYSSIVAWLAPSYQERGWSSAASGSLLAIMALCQAASALIMPALARKSDDRRPWLWLTLAMQVVGFAGIAFWPEIAPFAWAAIVGAGLGGCFALSMIVALDHLSDPAKAGALSALMQGGGFLLAALPPWIVALLHDFTGGFLAGWLLHLASVAVVIALTIRLAPHTYARAIPAANC